MEREKGKFPEALLPFFWREKKKRQKLHRLLPLSIAMFSSLGSLRRSAKTLSNLILHQPPHVSQTFAPSVNHGKNPLSQLLGRSPFFHSFTRRIHDAQNDAGMKHVGLLLNQFSIKKLCGNGSLGVRGRRFLSHWSHQPSRSWSSYTPNAEWVVLGLIGINTGVFTLWRIMDPSFMMANFTLSMENLRAWRLHTLLTSAFSHIDLSHLLSNMFGLYFFGSHMAQILGPGFLLKLYVAGGIVGSIFFLLHDSWNRSSSKGTFRRTYALGASAATNAIILLYIFLFPKSTIYFYSVIPVPAMVAGALMVGLDMLRTMQPDSHTSGVAHLGGAVVAALVWGRIKRGWF